MSQYCHLLIPNDADFTPNPDQVIEYLQSLVSLGATPLNPEIVFSKPTGKMMSRINPFTKLTEERKIWEPVSIQKLNDLFEMLTGLEEYSIFYKGQGPMPLPGFEFQEPFEGVYEVVLILKVVPQPVSMSHYYPPQAFEPIRSANPFSAMQQFERDNPHIVSFGETCGPACADAFYNHPDTLE